MARLFVLLSSMFYSYVLVLGFLASFGFSHKITGEGELKYHSVRLQSLLPNAVCTSSSKDLNPNSSRVVHQHGPCSTKAKAQPPRNPLSGPNPALHRRRVSGHAKLSPSQATTTTTNLPAQEGGSFASPNYIVTVAFGTPPQSKTVVFDTGSDVTWIQCQPCPSSSCYKQAQPFYDPSMSSTYANISCFSSDCSQFLKPKPPCSSDSRCQYNETYADGSNSSGFFSSETLTLTPSSVVPNFRFGCGDHSSTGFGTTAGLLGLGREKASLISQARQFGGVFSYCLPAVSSSTGYLKLGGGAPANVKYTPMITPSNIPTVYFLNLEAISVGGQMLAIPPAVFTATPGTIIDSGTVVTHLPPAAYTIVRDAFRKLMLKYPPAPAFSILDTCYNLTQYQHVNVMLPFVEMHFSGGVDLNVDFSGILYVSQTFAPSCLAFAANKNAGDLSVIGNVQQKRYSVVYDVANRRIGFGQKGC